MGAIADKLREGTQMFSEVLLEVANDIEALEDGGDAKPDDSGEGEASSKEGESGERSKRSFAERLGFSQKKAPDEADAKAAAVELILGSHDFTEAQKSQFNKLTAAIPIAELGTIARLIASGSSGFANTSAVELGIDAQMPEELTAYKTRLSAEVDLCVTAYQSTNATTYLPEYTQKSDGTCGPGSAEYHQAQREVAIRTVLAKGGFEPPEGYDPRGNELKKAGGI